MNAAAPAAPVATPAAPNAPNAPSGAPANISPPAPKAAAPAKAPVEAASAEAPKDEESLFELKVDGELKKFKRGEAERLLSKAAYADKVTQQAKEKIKEVLALKAELEAARAKHVQFEPNSPEEEAHARKVLERKLAEGQMTEDQRAAAKATAELETAKAELEKLRSERESQQVEAQAKALERKIASELEGAIERAGLQPGPDTIYAIHAAAKEARELGLPWDPDRIVEVAQENLDGSFKNLESNVLKGLKGKALVDRLGKAVVDEVLRWKVEEIRGGGAKPAAPPPAPKAEPQAYKSPQEIEELWRQRRQGVAK